MGRYLLDYDSTKAMRNKDKRPVLGLGAAVRM
jgi:hypothetical protein